MAEDLIAEVKDGVGHILFNRPQRLNAVSPEMVEAFIAATHRFEHDPEVRCVLIRGAGEVFMSGSDVKNFQRSLTEDREAHLAGMERRVVNGQLSIHRLRRMAKPVVVAVQGAASGFGLSVVCAADLAIAADDAVLSFAYRHVGLTADGGVSYFLPRILGERRALELTLLGERISAKQALEWGLLNRVVPKEKLIIEALALATRLAQGPTRALGGIKRLVRASLESSWDQQLAREAESIADVVGSDDHLEGVTAFLEKRPPRFTGR